MVQQKVIQCFNPYFIGLSILIFFDRNNNKNRKGGFNPYFIGLSILIRFDSSIFEWDC